MYELWLNSGHFSPRASSAPRKRMGKDARAGELPFVIVIPPPNVTGVLHIGHGLNNSLQDILIRYHRMTGVPTLWVPGTDHAGIATQHLVEKKLREEGLRKESMGRESFVKRVWKVKEEHHAVITDQLRKIGASCDWTRERFTLDEGLSAAVRKVFIELYRRGLVYKGSYLVNWSVGVQSAVSDDEVEFKDVNGFLYHINYPLEDGSGMLEIATTRPETMLGDTAVAVHPTDARYTEFIGKTIQLPLSGRIVPIVADEYVDPEFGTGCVKITPAHDLNDYHMGKRHELAEINIMNPDGTLNEHVPEKYRGLTMRAARTAVVNDLEERGLLVEKAAHRHPVGHCYRSNTVIEPYLSTQWFVKMKPLAEKALRALEHGDIRFFPRKWENTYRAWLENIRDWCISRQLWWGHRIPAWYDRESGEMLVSESDPSQQSEYAGRSFVQDEDVLDTWFSSWLWPFSVMGWPEDTNDMKDFFPTTALVSGYDIIFFWIARMVMASMEFTGKAPFRDIYITGLVRDKKGRKMSKSLGNGFDPLEIVDEYGADALRFTLAYLCTQGQDILLDKEKFSMGSRFANKIWNAARYLLMNPEETMPIENVRKNNALRAADRWILKRLNRVAEKVGRALGLYRFDAAAAAVYEFFWSEYCDWYIEISKLSLYSEDASERRRIYTLLIYVLEEGLKLLHPFLPYITEEIFQKLPGGGNGKTPSDGGVAPRDGDGAASPAKAPGAGDGGSGQRVLMAEPYPVVEEWREFTEEGFEDLMELVRSVRTLRSEFNISSRSRIRVAVCFEENYPWADCIQSEENVVSTFCTADLEWRRGNAGLDRAGAVAVVGKGYEAFVYIRSMIDVDEVLKRFRKTIRKESAALEQTEGKLRNKGFLSGASAEIIEQERRKHKDLSRRIEKMRAYIEDLQT